MTSEMKLKVNTKSIKKYYNHYPLITKQSLENTSELYKEGTIINLYDNQDRFIAKGYYGVQNKGIGWVLTHEKKEAIDGLFFKKRLADAVAKREIYFKGTKTTAFRVFNGEGDGIGGLTIDYFAGYYLINWYSEGIYQFKDFIYPIVKDMPNFKGLYQKRRYDIDGKFIDEDGFVMGVEGEFPLIVQENDVNFAVYLNEGAMVGIFLDQRDVRKRIRDKYAKGRTVLNTFSYTGAFSVFAALGGAIKTTSVDLANRSYAKTIEQFSMNAIDLEAQEIIVDDVFDYFKYANKMALKFGMVILDPPSFAKSKKLTFAAEKDYVNLLKEAINITEDKGIIVASTNCSSFDMKEFLGFIALAFEQLKVKYTVLESHALPRDFVTDKHYKEGNYLKVVFIEKG